MVRFRSQYNRHSTTTMCSLNLQWSGHACTKHYCFHHHHSAHIAAHQIWMLDLGIYHKFIGGFILVPPVKLCSCTTVIYMLYSVSVSGMEHVDHVFSTFPLNSALKCENLWSLSCFIQFWYYFNFAYASVHAKFVLRSNAKCKNVF